MLMKWKDKIKLMYKLKHNETCHIWGENNFVFRDTFENIIKCYFILETGELGC